jgi:hypothetical protein
VNSGLTLHSTYGGTGHPVNKLTLTASNTTGGEKISSVPQTIKVTDPPATFGVQIALLGQYAASSFATSGAGHGATPGTDPAGRGRSRSSPSRSTPEASWSGRKGGRDRAPV